MPGSLRIVLLLHTGEAVNPVQPSQVFGTWSARETRYKQCRVWMHDPERRCWIAMMPSLPEPDPRLGQIVLMRESEDPILPIPMRRPLRPAASEDPPDWTDVPDWVLDTPPDPGESLPNDRDVA